MSEIGSLPPNEFERRYNGFEQQDYHVLGPNAPELDDGTSNIACAYTPDLEMKMLLRPVPRARPDEVVVRIRSAGICGSDVHFWKDGFIADSVVSKPCCAGHESAGEITDVGEDFKDKYKVGDRVALEMGIPCGQADCEMCLSGRYNGCPHTVFFSTPPYHGSLGRYHAHPAAWVHKLPDNVSLEEGAMCEPLCVALAGIERSGLKLADPVVISGAGPIGLATMLAARAAGAAPIVITDVVQSRLDFAKKLLPSVTTVRIDPKKSPQDMANHIRQAAGVAIRIVIECTGVESAMWTATFVVVFGGRVHIIGVGKNTQTYPFSRVSEGEIDISFQFRYTRQYPKAIRMVEHGLIDLKPFVTHRIPLNRAIEAFNIAADPSQGAIKVHIVDP